MRPVFFEVGISILVRHLYIETTPGLIAGKNSPSGVSLVEYEHDTQ